MDIQKETPDKTQDQNRDLPEVLEGLFISLWKFFIFFLRIVYNLPFIRIFNPWLNCIWMTARLDLLRWIRKPVIIICAVVPPLGMALLLYVLTISVGKQPIALVSQDPGPLAQKLIGYFTADSDAYILRQTDLSTAKKLLADQEVAAIIFIPADFDKNVYRSFAGTTISLILNNVDIDFADDIRRSVDRTALQFNSPTFFDPNDVDDFAVTTTFHRNPYHISISEKTLRQTNVDFISYQIIPVLILLVLSVGLIGTAFFCATDSELGLSNYLSFSPQSSMLLIAGRLLSGVIASLIALILPLIYGYFSGVISTSATHWVLLLLLFIATGACASGIGAVVGSVVRGTRTVTMISSIMATYLFFLGGGFTTIAYLPSWLRIISAFDPIRYAIDGIRQILFYPTLVDVSLDLMVLFATAFVSIILGALLIRKSWMK